MIIHGDDSIKMKFSFSTSDHILFGPGRFNDVPEIVRQYGQRLLIITGKRHDRFEYLADMLSGRQLQISHYAVHGEPTTDIIMDASRQARYKECDCIIGVGGGSVIDAGKAVAAMLTNDGDIMDYLEVIGLGRPLQNAAMPYIAIPTTAGTGAEVTKNAVLRSTEHRVKVSMRHVSMIPKAAVIDPELMCSMPPSVTATTGMDALTQLIEAFISRKANPMTDALCREGIKRAVRSLKQAYDQGSDLQAREDMAIASLLSGIALANAGLGAVHGFAGPIGGLFSAPHGAICARLLPYVLDTNTQCMPQNEKLVALAQLVTQQPDASPADAMTMIADLGTHMHIPPLSTYGISEQDFPEIIQKSKVSSSMKGNPVTLSDTQLEDILLQAL